MRNGILLDLDGTLVDSRADLALAVNLTRKDLGLPALPEAQVVSYVGEGAKLLLERALPECPGQAAVLQAAFREHYRAHLVDHTRLYPGVAAALERFQAQSIPLMVVTNKPRECTGPILEQLGIARFMAAVVGGGDAPALKPDPQPLLLALSRAGCRAEGSWMAGDHFTDLQAGRRAGLRRCYCRYGFGNPGEETWDLAVDDLTELAEWLNPSAAARS